MTPSPDKLRREARRLRRAVLAGTPEALARAAAVLADPAAMRHADALHVVAREAGFDSWPKLKIAAEIAAMDRAQRAERLKAALYFGQNAVVERLLASDPGLPSDNLGLQVALLRADAVAAALAGDPDAATRPVGPRSPILHLAFSRHWQHVPDGAAASVEIAGMLVRHGADVNDGYAAEPDSDHRLSALYGALGHARNLDLARWLLDHGADPNDDESLYHATELGHHEGLRMLLARGARPEGTNALPRAIDFDDAGAVKLLLEAGADPNEGVAPHPSGVPMGLVPALHQTARRRASAKIAALLLDHGADPRAVHEGHTPYAMARIYGNREVAALLETRGATTPLSPVEELLARAADGRLRPDDRVTPGDLDPATARILNRLAWQPGALDHIRRLVAIGLDPDMPDEMGMTPLHLAAWEGLPEAMRYFLALGADLDHVNGYGGTLFSTVLHGSENCPQRGEAGRDHIACMRLALEAGADLPRGALDGAVDPEMAGFLADWAETHPGQVVAHGVY